MQAWNDIHLGRWTEAASEIEAGAELARETGQAMWSMVADVAAALLAAMRGDDDQVERALARVGPSAIGRENGWVASTVEVIRAIDELSAGRPELAFDRLHDTHRVIRGGVAWAIDHFADAAVLSGRVDEARAQCSTPRAARSTRVEGRSTSRPGSTPAPCWPMTGPRTNDSASPSTSSPAWPIHRARLQLHRGRWLRRHRRVADSRVPLRAARELFEAARRRPPGRASTARAPRQRRAQPPARHHGVGPALAAGVRDRRTWRPRGCRTARSASSSSCRIGPWGAPLPDLSQAGRDLARTAPPGPGHRILTWSSERTPRVTSNAIRRVSGRMSPKRPRLWFVRRHGVVDGSADVSPGG